MSDTVPKSLLCESSLLRRWYHWASLLLMYSGSRLRVWIGMWPTGDCKAAVCAGLQIIQLKLNSS